MPIGEFRYIQPKSHPTRKVAAATLGSAVGASGGAAALIWLAGMVGLTVPTDVAMFVTGLIGTFFGGYMATDRVQGM